MTHLLTPPLLTEKSLRLAGNHRYTFLVEPKASKTQIRSAIESAFTVKVININTAILPGQSHRTRTGHTTITPSYKKAIVTLKSGQTLDVFTKVTNKKPS